MRYSRLISLAAFGGVLLASLLLGCSVFAPDEEAIPPPAADWGTADFTVYVALGNSLTAGYQSGALYASTQQYSYPAGLAYAMRTGFEVPWIADPGYYNFVDPIGHLKLAFDAEGDASIVPTPWPGEAPEFLNKSLTKPYNNLGIPRATTADLLNAKSMATSLLGSPYFDVILRNGQVPWDQLYPGALSDSLTAVEQALLLNPTFVTLWVGSNEILIPATQGLGTPVYDDVTFGQLYGVLVDSLVSGTADSALVVANIPAITAIPYFTTVPWFIIDPGGNPVDWNPGNEEPDYLGWISAEGTATNPAFPGLNFLQAGELTLLPAMSYDGNEDGTPDIEQGMGVPRAILVGLLTQQLIDQGVPPADAAAQAEQLVDTAFPLNDQPIPGALTLVTSEVTSLANAVSQYNAAISAVAAAYNPPIPIVGIYDLFNEIAANGIDYRGVHYTTDLVTGGLFSLDGIHGSNIGYTIVAEAFAEVINARYGSVLVPVGPPIAPSPPGGAN